MQITLRDSHSNEIDDAHARVNAWSSAEWTFRIPAEAPLGNYNVSASTPQHRGAISGEILVAAYRRPDFRVDVTLDVDSSLAGTKLNGVINGRYLFGAPMAGRPVNWTYSKTRAHRRAAEDHRALAGRPLRVPRPRLGSGRTVDASHRTEEGTLDAKGRAGAVARDRRRPRACRTLHARRRRHRRLAPADRRPRVVPRRSRAVVHRREDGRRTSPTRRKASTPRSSPRDSTASPSPAST